MKEAVPISSPIAKEPVPDLIATKTFVEMRIMNKQFLNNSFKTEEQQKFLSDSN
ncbi:hypothetical protein BY996DRAFT_6586589 [Phakopsora pachyrhizi]|nr:hypothetical protein BY996DRAFT_6586589 [Phakopsora pachyrhizi]